MLIVIGIDVCLDFLGKAGGNPDLLSPKNGLPDRIRLQIQRFVSGIRVLVPNSQGKRIARVVKKLSSSGAAQLSFTLRDGGTMTVANYFKQTYNNPLKHPNVLCAEARTCILCFTSRMLTIIRLEMEH